LIPSRFNASLKFLGSGIVVAVGDCVAVGGIVVGDDVGEDVAVIVGSTVGMVVGMSVDVRVTVGIAVGVDGGGGAEVQAVTKMNITEITSKVRFIVLVLLWSLLYRSPCG